MLKKEKEELLRLFTLWWNLNKERKDVWSRNPFGVHLKQTLQEINRWKAIVRGTPFKVGGGE